MKIGVRKPSLKKSLKARTVGKAKRKVKKALIPGYGKKGSGWVKNPKKAAYNAVYSRTTVGVGDIAKAVTSSGKSKKKASTKPKPKATTSSAIAELEPADFAKELAATKTPAQLRRALTLAKFGGWCGLHRFYLGYFLMGCIYLCTAGGFLIGWAHDVIAISKALRDSQAGIEDD